MPSSVSAGLRWLIVLSLLTGTLYLLISGKSPREIAAALSRLLAAVSAEGEPAIRHEFSPASKKPALAVSPPIPETHSGPPDVASALLSSPVSQAPRDVKPFAAGTSTRASIPQSVFWPAEVNSPRPAVVKTILPNLPAALASTATPSGPLPTAGVRQSPREEMTAIEERLKQLGAVHYRLERWGAGGEVFRFQCKMALPANPRYLRYFEAADLEPLPAMQRVLAEVEAWRQ